MSPRRACLAVVVGCSLAFSWLLMQAVHELGHVLHAWLSGGSVVRVVLHPRELSHTELGRNPHPHFVAWGGVLWGAALPAALLLSSRPGQRIRHMLRFFAGFCLVANGAYLLAGTLARAGDPADLMRLGTPPMLLLVAGSLVAAAGLLVWHRLGPTVGFAVHAAPTACRTPLQSRRRLAWGAVLVLAGALAWSLLPSHWTLPREGGTGRCEVAEHEPRAIVLGRCGQPIRTGGQPKVPGRRFPSMCSAPCDVYGDRLLYYDCEGGLAAVVRLDPGDYQGCLFPSSKEPVKANPE